MTHPELDEDLWRGTNKPEDWLDPNDVRVAPALTSALKSESVLQASQETVLLRACSWCEICSGTFPDDENDFDRVLHEGSAEIPSLFGRWSWRSTGSLNRTATRNRTTGSRCGKASYDVAPATFVALYSQPADSITVTGPHLAEWVTAWLPDDLRRVDQFALTANPTSERPSRIVIDREVYLTLREAAVGLGRSTWSRSVARKVTRFVDEQHRVFHRRKLCQDLEIRNVDTNLRAKVQVRREPARYEL